jgi:hypothetical protein
MNACTDDSLEKRASFFHALDGILALGAPATPRAGARTKDAQAVAWVYKENDLLVSKTMATYFSSSTGADVCSIEGFSKKELAKAKLPDTSTRLIDRVESSYLVKYQGHVVFQGSLFDATQLPSNQVCRRIKKSYQHLLSETIAQRTN